MSYLTDILAHERERLQRRRDDLQDQIRNAEEVIAIAGTTLAQVNNDLTELDLAKQRLFPESATIPE